MNNVVWILVCDSARARLFETRDHEPKWRSVATFDHVESRGKAADLSSDHMGSRAAQGQGVHHNALAPASSPQENEKSHFAHTLMTMLDHGIRTKRFDYFTLVAPPHFLGLIKNELSVELQKHLLSTVDKDLIHLDAEALHERLKQEVRIPVDKRATLRESSLRKH